MKIISKFQDYYDTGLAYGADEKIRFKRKTEIMDKQFVENMPDIVPNWSPLSGMENKNHKFEFGYAGILFCGKLYIAIQVFDHKDPEYIISGGNYLPKCFYTSEDLEKYLQQCEFELTYKSKLGGKSHLRSKFEIQNRNILKEGFGNLKYYDYMVENKIVTLVCAKFFSEMWNKEFNNINYNNSNFLVVNNPCLKNLQFFKVLNSFQAYQEIAMWVGGVLPQDSTPMIELDDKYKITEHGFDKFSFRKSPES
jgi:hypothetical protein